MLEAFTVVSITVLLAFAFYRWGYRDGRHDAALALMTLAEESKDESQERAWLN